MIILQLMYFMLPAYGANMSPILGKNILKSFAKPLDFGYKWKGKRILGDHKTWRGLFLGVVVGALIFLLQQKAYSIPFFFNS